MEKSFGWKKIMSTKLIIVCSRCGGLLLSNADQKTKACIYCGSRFIVNKAKKLATAKDALEASKILQQIKRKKKFNKTTII